MFKRKTQKNGIIKCRVSSLITLSVFLMLMMDACDYHKTATIADPKQRLTDYISKSFSMRTISDRAVLSRFLMGDVKVRLDNWSEDQFREEMIDSKREFIKLSFREIKQISSTEVEITYEISFLDYGHDHRKQKDEKAHPSKITSKKLCQMIFSNNNWYITDVRNIKELVEYQNELSLP